MDDLPFIDEYTRVIAAPPERVWAALVRVLPRAFGGSRAERFARIVGCDITSPSGLFPEQGSALVGFQVARVAPARELAIVGRHRYADYALLVRLRPLDDGAATKLSAQTRAEFPGVMGRAYRLAVIGTGGHKIVVRRLLRAVERRSLRPLDERDGTSRAAPRSRN